MSIAQEKFDKDYRSMRMAVVVGVLTKQDMRDWIWIKGNQTALAAELEMNDAWEREARERAERELKLELIHMWGPGGLQDEE